MIRPGRLLVAGLALALGCSPANPLPADTILVNGKIITVDPDDTIVESLAIRDGKIVALGSTSRIESLSGEGTAGSIWAAAPSPPG